MRRRPAVLLGACVLAVSVAACSGGDSSAARSDQPARSASTSTPASTPAPTTTAPPPSTAPPNLDAARVALTRVAATQGATALAVAPGDRSLYVAQQGGQVVAIRDGALDPTPVLDLSGRISTGGERGLLGLTFSPDGTRLYVDYTNPQGLPTLAEYAFSNGRVDAGSARVLLSVPHPQPNHNGGQVTFGPDGFLYMGIGDGGAANDEGAGHAPGGNGQSLDTLLGKILRIDPKPTLSAPYSIPAGNPFANGGGRPEIWAYGLRNPWRFSFDRSTNDLWIADVGQNLYEEIDFMPAGQGAGANYGWNRLEGFHAFRGSAPANAVPPVLELAHSNGYCAVVGGFVYRGAKIPDLRDAYVYGDDCNPTISAIRVDGGKVVASRNLGVQLRSVSSFGQDADGELYVLSLAQGVYRIDPAA
jgi:glucose/arabinose dehydrogenase